MQKLVARTAAIAVRGSSFEKAADHRSGGPCYLLPAERGHPDHDREATSSIPQPEVRNALPGQREVLEHGGRPVAGRGLGADAHPDRCWVVIPEEANQLPGLPREDEHGNLIPALIVP